MPGKPLPDDRYHKKKKSVTLDERLVEITPSVSAMEEHLRSQFAKEILDDMLERVDDLASFYFKYHCHNDNTFFYSVSNV